MNNFLFIISFLLLSRSFSSANDITKQQYSTSFDSVQISYQDYGKSDTTLLFIHGWCCNSSHWKYQLDKFAIKYRVVTIDLAGHGNSGSNRESWSMQAFGKDITSVIEKLNLNNIILIAHSAGGFSALEAAKINSEKVIGIIGVDSYRYIKNGYFEKEMNPEKIQEYKDYYKSDFKEKITNQVKTRFFLESADTSIVNWISRDMSSIDPEIAASCVIAYYEYRYNQFKESLKTVGSKIPIIAINNDKSIVELDYIKNYSPLFEVQYMNNVGHFIMLENPKEFNSLLDKDIQQILDY